MLKFCIDHQKITRMDDFYVVADSANYLTAEFSFTDDWTGVKTAVFRRGENWWNVLLTDDACTVPWEALQGQGILYVSAFCNNLVTANSAPVRVYQSGYMDEMTEPPTPTVYSQILDALGEVQATLDDVIDTATDAATEAATSASDAAESAQAARESAESIEGAVEAAQAAAQTATDAAGTATDAASVASDSATAAASSASTASSKASEASADAERIEAIMVQAEHFYTATVDGEDLLLEVYSG